jgi:transposase IS481 family protein
VWSSAIVTCPAAGDAKLRIKAFAAHGVRNARPTRDAHGRAPLWPARRLAPGALASTTGSSGALWTKLAARRVGGALRDRGAADRRRAPRSREIAARAVLGGHRMRLHANAGLSVKGRVLLIERITVAGWSLSVAAEAAGISDRTAFKWMARYRADGACRAAGSLLGAPCRGQPHRRAPGRGDRGAPSAALHWRRDRRGCSTWRCRRCRGS